MHNLKQKQQLKKTHTNHFIKNKTAQITPKTTHGQNFVVENGLNWDIRGKMTQSALVPSVGKEVQTKLGTH